MPDAQPQQLWLQEAAVRGLVVALMGNLGASEDEATGAIADVACYYLARPENHADIDRKPLEEQEKIVFTAARNVIVRGRMRAARRRKIEVLKLAVDRLRDQADRPNTVESHELMAKLNANLSQLEVSILLWRCDGETFRTIGQKIGRNPGQACRLFHQAVEIARAVLSDAADG